MFSRRAGRMIGAISAMSAFTPTRASFGSI
jgi:hypothetical protein